MMYAVVNLAIYGIKLTKLVTWSVIAPDFVLAFSLYALTQNEKLSKQKDKL